MIAAAYLETAGVGQLPGDAAQLPTSGQLGRLRRSSGRPGPPVSNAVALLLLAQGTKQAGQQLLWRARSRPRLAERWGRGLAPGQQRVKRAQDGIASGQAHAVGAPLADTTATEMAQRHSWLEHRLVRSTAAADRLC